MHLVLFGADPRHLFYVLPTAVTYLLLVGAAYGIVRLLRDLLEVFGLRLELMRRPKSREGERAP